MKCPNKDCGYSPLKITCAVMPVYFPDLDPDHNVKESGNHVVTFHCLGCGELLNVQTSPEELAKIVRMKESFPPIDAIP